MKWTILVVLVVGAVLFAADPSLLGAKLSLSEAIERGNVREVTPLLKKQGALNGVLDCGRTPLQFATWIGNDDVVAALLDRGADPNKADPATGYSPLCCAATRGDLSAMRMLVNAGANVNCKDHSGRTPLHDAIACVGDVNCVKWLLDHGADINARSEDGWTPLHLAAIRGDMAMVKLLLDRGAKPWHRNESGNTPRTEAIDAQQWQVADYLHEVWLAMVHRHHHHSHLVG